MAPLKILLDSINNGPNLMRHLLTFSFLHPSKHLRDVLHLILTSSNKPTLRNTQYSKLMGLAELKGSTIILSHHELLTLFTIVSGPISTAVDNQYRSEGIRYFSSLLQTAYAIFLGTISPDSEASEAADLHYYRYGVVGTHNPLGMISVMSGTRGDENQGAAYDMIMTGSGLLLSSMKHMNSLVNVMIVDETVRDNWAKEQPMGMEEYIKHSLRTSRSAKGRLNHFRRTNVRDAPDHGLVENGRNWNDGLLILEEGIILFDNLRVLLDLVKTDKEIMGARKQVSIDIPPAVLSISADHSDAESD